MHRILTLLAGVAMMIALPVNAAAQNGYEVKGQVVDQIGPVIGAAIVEAGTSTGTMTNPDGSFSLVVSSANATVEVSCMGYATQTYTASQMPSTIVLAEDTEFIEEAVVIGYGTVKKSDMTGSVSTVKADQLNKGVVTSPSSLLQGKSAGVVITPGDGQPGSSSTIRIRGGSSLSANNNPLVVVDGLPISEVGISGVSDALASINPNDIESFSVLKDASATAIYGSRASNGVIIITTKKGSRGGGIHVNADFTASLSQNTKFVDVLTGDELRDLMGSLYGTDSEPYAAIGSANTDWQREIFQLGQNYEGNVALSGSVNAKNAKAFSMPYRVSFGVTSQDGTLKTSEFDRQTLSLNLNPTMLDDHLTVNLSGKGMTMYNRFANQDAIGAAVRYNPGMPVLSEEEGRSWNHYSAWLNQDGTINTQAGMNPVALLNDRTDVSRALRFIGSAQFIYKVHGFEDLSLNLNLGMDVSESSGVNEIAKGSELSYHGASTGAGALANYSQFKRDQTLEFYANYNKDLGKHNINAMAGYSWQHNYYETFGETHRLDGSTEADAGYYISNPVTFRTEYYLVSFFGRVNYSWDGRLNVTATLRNDGTSRFDNNKWGLFPSAAVSYNFGKEDFVRNSNWLSALKLRLSWGQTGQQDINQGNYPTLPTYTYNTNQSMYIFGNQVIVPIKPNGYNADLKWETTTTYNAGVDFGVLDDRLTFAVDAYHRETKDLINYTPVAAGANLTNYLTANIGDLANNGFEVEVNAVPVETRDWSWTIGLNAAYNKTTVTRLTTDDEREDYLGEETGNISGGTGNKVQIHQTGQSPYSFFVFQQVYDTDGRPIEGAYVDRNGDGTIDNYDKYCFHKGTPDWTFGFNTQLSYKQWTLALSAHANVGNYMYNNVASNGNLLTDLWTNRVINNRHSSALTNNVATYAQYWSDMYVEDASFLKIDNITLSRNFSFGNKLPMNFNVFVTVQNVATITGYDGIDPEIYLGIDNNLYPRPRTYILGVKFNF